MSVDEGIQLRQDLPRTKSDDDDEEELPSPEPAAGPSSGRKTKPQTSCLVPGCRGYSGPNLMWHLTEVHLILCVIFTPVHPSVVGIAIV